MRTYSLVLVLWVLVPQVASAQEWAEKMFDHTSHDFGTVARGAEVEHRFTFENPYVEDVHVASVESSCHCTVPKIVKPTLKTYEIGEIVAHLDTRKFLGRKEATLRVVIDKPFQAEVQLHVYSYIRSDIVLEPGSARFGTVDMGNAAHTKLKLSYAGRADWQILRVESGQPYLKAKAVETSRNVSGEVEYDLWIDLKDDAPVGYLKDHVILVTNDANTTAQRVPVLVEGVIAPAISAHPSPLSVGIVRLGQTVTRNLVLRGKKPFSILSVAGPDQRYSFASSEGVKPVHLVPVTFAASGTPGRLAGEIRVETDLKGSEVVTVPVEGRVLSADGSGAAPSAEDVPAGESSAATPRTGRDDGWQAVAR